jgi:hypothetical protein
MNQTQSRELILKEWLNWTPKSTPPTYQEKMDFHMWLEGNRPDLLLFRVRRGVDKWQTIHAWLNELER